MTPRYRRSFCRHESIGLVVQQLLLHGFKILGFPQHAKVFVQIDAVQANVQNGEIEVNPPARAELNAALVTEGDMKVLQSADDHDFRFGADAEAIRAFEPAAPDLFFSMGRGFPLAPFFFHG